MLRLIVCIMLVFCTYISLSTISSQKPLPDPPLPKNTPRSVAILSTSLHPRYLFTIPVAVAAWRKLGAESLILFVGDPSLLETNYHVKITIALLERLGARIILLKNTKLSTATLSQIARLFAASLPASNDFPLNTTFIVSDTDLIPFKLRNHIPDQTKGYQLQVYNAIRTSDIEIPPARGNQTVKMYSMLTIGATVQAWRKIMNFKEANYDSKAIETYAEIEFGKGFFHPNDTEKADLKSSLLWYADQSLLSYKLEEWKKNPKQLAATYEWLKKPRRMDRQNWPKKAEFFQFHKYDFDDAHVLMWGFDDAGWERFRHFIDWYFADDAISWALLYDYRDKFAAKPIEGAELLKDELKKDFV
uniref:Glycosyltransferase family 8 protein n=1 Tax=Panagrellus redivivus TaxID=6233 RepID=A0A7E4WAC0_PANRE